MGGAGGAAADGGVLRRHDRREMAGGPPGLERRPAPGPGRAVGLHVTGGLCRPLRRGRQVVVRARLGRRAWPVPYWYGDAAFGVMAALLGAVDAGLGACILGAFRGEAELARVIGVPAEWRLFCAVVLGHPDGDDRRSPFAATALFHPLDPSPSRTLVTTPDPCPGTPLRLSSEALQPRIGDLSRALTNLTPCPGSPAISPPYLVDTGAQRSQRPTRRQAARRPGRDGDGTDCRRSRRAACGHRQPPERLGRGHTATDRDLECADRTAAAAAPRAPDGAGRRRQRKTGTPRSPSQPRLSRCL